MSIFFAPTAERPVAKGVNRYRRIAGLATILVLLIAVGAAVICYLYPASLNICLIIWGIDFLLAIGASLYLRRVSTAGGRDLLAWMYDDAGQRSLNFLLEQIFEAEVLIQPSFQIGEDRYDFALATLNSQGLTLIRTSRGTDTPSAPAVKAFFRRLGEQHALNPLMQVRLVQLINGPGEAKIGPDWQQCLTRDLNRLYPRTPGGPVQSPQVAKAFRLLYNLALRPAVSPVPIDGSLPAAPRPNRKGIERAGSGGSVFETIGKVFLIGLLSLVLIGAAVYIVQLYDFELAEKAMAPARQVLRGILPPEWEFRLALGTETPIDEEHVYAEIITSTPLSSTVGQPGDRITLAAGMNVRITQIDYALQPPWYLVWSADGKEAGWVPGSALHIRHLIPKGTALYQRPDSYAQARSNTKQDAPAALLSVWEKPSAAGSVTWSKVLFQDKHIWYVKGDF